MEVVLKHVGTAAWASDRLNMSVQTSVSCTAQTLRTCLGTIGTSSLPCINPAQCHTHIGGRECQGLVVCREPCLEGHLLVVPVKVAKEVVKLIRLGGVAGWSGGGSWLIACDDLDALPHASGVVGVTLELLPDP